MREWSVARTAIDEGYEQYAKQGKACVLPAMAWPDVALPPSLNSWLISQPDSVLSTVSLIDSTETENSSCLTSPPRSKPKTRPSP